MDKLPLSMHDICNLNTLKLGLGLAAISDVLLPGRSPLVLGGIGLIGGCLLLSARTAHEQQDADKFATPLGGLGAGYFLASVSGYPSSSALIAGIAVMAFVMYKYTHAKQKRASDHPLTFRFSEEEDSKTCPSGSGRGRHTNFVGFGREIF